MDLGSSAAGSQCASDVKGLASAQGSMFVSSLPSQIRLRSSLMSSCRPHDYLPYETIVEIAVEKL